MIRNDGVVERIREVALPRLKRIVGLENDVQRLRALRKKLEFDLVEITESFHNQGLWERDVLESADRALKMMATTTDHIVEYNEEEITNAWHDIGEESGIEIHLNEPCETLDWWGRDYRFWITIPGECNCSITRRISEAQGFKQLDPPGECICFSNKTIFMLGGCPSWMSLIARTNGEVINRLAVKNRVELTTILTLLISTSFSPIISRESYQNDPLDYLVRLIDAFETQSAVA